MITRTAVNPLLEPFSEQVSFYIEIVSWLMDRCKKDFDFQLYVQLFEEPFFFPFGLICVLKVINFFSTLCEGYSGEYWPEFVAVWTKHSEVSTRTSEGQYFAVMLKQARLK